MLFVHEHAAGYQRTLGEPGNEAKQQYVKKVAVHIGKGIAFLS
jgi:hypothetical protein